MASDSEEGFESADDEITSSHKNTKHHKLSEKTKKLTIEENINKPIKKSDDTKKSEEKNVVIKDPEEKKVVEKEPEGWESDWDDFDVDDNQEKPAPKQNENKTVVTNASPTHENSEDNWDDFGDWGNDNQNSKIGKDSPEKTSGKLQEHSEKEYKELADRLSSMGEQNSGTASGWGGWGGWGVTSLLSSGVSQLTSHVSQGIASVTQVLETGMGVPDPEELAQSQKLEKEKLSPVDNENKNKLGEKTIKKDPIEKENVNKKEPANLNQNSKEEDSTNVFRLGKLVSNVTKLVETTGSAVVTGGLDTLEEIGKRTIRVLQGEEDGKKRLSTILKEARDRFEECPPDAPVENSPKKVCPKFEALFDDFQGLVHLEALEMLSKQCDMKLQSLLSSLEGKELTEMKETLDQVKDICELPDEDEDDEKEDGQLSSDVLHNKLKESIKDMGIQIQFDAIISCWGKIITDTACPEESNTEEESSEDVLLEKAEDIMFDAIKNLAQSSALSVQLLHRATALLSVRERRSTADEADGLTQLTTVLSSHIGEIAALYSQKLNEIYKKCNAQEKVNTYITNVFLEAGKGSSYIQDAFLLTIPILQVGAT